MNCDSKHSPPRAHESSYSEDTVHITYKQEIYQVTSINSPPPTHLPANWKGHTLLRGSAVCSLFPSLSAEDLGNHQVMDTPVKGREGLRIHSTRPISCPVKAQSVYAVRSAMPFIKDEQLTDLQASQALPSTKL